MFELTIKRKDGSIYWVERFKTQAEASRWLAEEMTRPYWVSDYVCEIVDKTPPPKPAPTPQELAAIAAQKTAIDTLVTRLNQLNDQTDLTAADIKETIIKLLKLKRLKGEI